ncbi:MAG: HD domain-containing protein [Eubacterium sp.]|nr:HD domain-containing protein [Eubacterium sp.]
MIRINGKKKLLYTIILILLGVFINRLGANIVSVTGCPLYLDSIGTMIVAVVGGLAPGSTVGFITNMIGGFSDTSTFYYGLFNVVIAVIAGKAADKGFFDKLYKVFYLIPIFLLLSIPCSLLTYILYGFKIADNASMPIANILHSRGMSVLMSQTIADFCIELPDKLISILVAYLVCMLIPKKVKDEFIVVAGRDVSDAGPENMKIWHPLRSQVAKVLTLSGLAITIVAFAISYKTYMESKIAGFTTGNYNMHEIRTETLLYCGKMFSAVLGLLICIVSWSMVLANRRVVSPLNKMAKEMGRFAYDTEKGRDKSIEKIESLDIHTENEIEELYLAMMKTVKDIDEYIDKTTEQAEIISDLNINIITALADIVESRDETTGNHVKRTAAYCALIAGGLLEKGKYKDLVTEEYINTLTIAAPLHDIGKIKIPDAILNKPGRLTDEEFEIIKTHTVLGFEMLESISETMGTTEYLQMAKNIALHHHEWWDGSSKGYPRGLKGEQIPLSARIMAVADVFDALVSKRPYKDGFSVEKAFEIMKEESGTHFDPELVEILIENKENLLMIKERYDE